MWGSAVVIIAIFSAGQASAETNTSSSIVSQSAPQLLDNVYLTYWGEYYGPSITNPTAAYPNVKTQGGKAVTDTSGPQYMDSIVTGGYRLGPSLIAGVGQEFYLSPVNYQNHDYTLFDPFLTVINKKLVHTDQFNLAADARAYVPTSSDSQLSQKLAHFRSVQVMTYSIPRSRFTPGVYFSEEAAYFNQYISNQKQREWRFLVEPFASYQITPTFASTLWVDLIQLHHLAGTAGAHNKYADIEPGVSWQITPTVSLKPFLNIYPINPIGNDISANFILSAALI
jgi:hypothetical protein